MGGGVRGYFDDTTDDDLMQAYSKNTMSTFNMTKKAMPWLLKAGGEGRPNCASIVHRPTKANSPFSKTIQNLHLCTIPFGIVLY